MFCFEVCSCIIFIHFHYLSQRSSSILLFYFVPGLRVLPESDAANLMDKIRKILSNKSLNPFVFNPQNVRILSGEEEGVFAWITVNYLKDFFGSNR